MTATATTPAVDRPPRPARPDKPRTSILSLLLGLGVVALSWGALAAASTNSHTRSFAVDGWFALAAGAVIGSLTPLSRPFRRVSAWPAAIAVAGFLAYGSYQGADVSTWRGIWLVAAVILGLDLCWVARLRIWVFVSGICLIPALVISGGAPLWWAVAWLAVAFLALWSLSNDVHRSVAASRPRTGPGGASGRRRGVRRPGDLARILVVGLSLGVVVGMAADSPAFTFRPLERLVRYLPFQPDLDLGIDVDIRDYEVDDQGHEIRYRLTPDGQRFVLDRRTSDVLAVIERNGVDEFVTYDDRVVATIEGASVLHVPSADGTTTTTFDRDDEGWFLTAGGDRFDVELLDGLVGLRSPSGYLAISDRVTGAVSLEDPSYSALAAATGGTVTLPRAAIVEGTTGEPSDVWRYADVIEIGNWRQGRRTYQLGEELEVDVDRQGSNLAYSWNSDRSTMTVYVEDLRQEGSLDIDRTGNVFDHLDKWLQDQSATTESDDGTPWRRHLRMAMTVLLAVGAIAGAVVLVRRRRRGGTPDRTWAESVVARLDAYGASRTDPRADAESVVAHLDRLARTVDDDRDRLRDVAEVLDHALYGDGAVTPGDRRRVDAVVDDVLHDRPPDRTGPRRPGRPDDTEPTEDDRVPELTAP